MIALLTTVLGPLIGLALKILFQCKVIKSEEELKEIERRVQAAIKAADRSKIDAIDAHQQYDGAKQAAKDEWSKRF